MVEPVSIRLIKSASSRVTAKPWTSWDVMRREALDRTFQQRHRIMLQQYFGEQDWRLRMGFKPIRNLIRFDPGLLPSPPPGWERQVVHSWRPWQYDPEITHINLEPAPTPAAPAAPAAGGWWHINRDPAPTATVPAADGWWESAARGIPVGVSFMAAILLLLRIADRCLHHTLFKQPIRRRRSEEWPTPNVMATNLTVRMPSDCSSNRPPSPSTTQSNEQDLPPPYSECATGDTTETIVTSSRPKTEREEPPPPYSACYVAYSNPKDGPPSVHFLTQQCQNLFANYEAGPSSVHDTGQSDDDGPQEDSNLNHEGTRVVEGAGDSENVQIDVPDDGIVYSENIDNETEEEVKEVTALAQERYIVV